MRAQTHTRFPYGVAVPDADGTWEPWYAALKPSTDDANAWRGPSADKSESIVKGVLLWLPPMPLLLLLELHDMERCGPMEMSDRLQ